MSYTALMMDIVNSKKITKDNREELQKYIKTCLLVLNKLFRPSLEFDVIFSAGDEFQGLFANPYSAFMYFRLLKMILYPLKIRCGIGVGDWEVRINDGTSSEQDGSAYHYARNAIQETEAMEGHNVLLDSNDNNDFLINTLLNASIHLTGMQSDYQSEISFIVELLNPLLDSTGMDQDSFKDLLKLYGSKDRKLFSTKKDMNFNMKYDNRFEVCEVNPINIFPDIIKNQKIYLESNIRKGIPTQISSITGTTRQNIDSMLKRANTAVIRNIDLTIILYLYKNFQGES